MSLSRKEKLPKLIVEDFIKTAEPVGSNYLIKKYNLDLSSATIRNEMNSLEKEGLLEKTHTSSGRVPSTKGYEYYIEHLRNKTVNEKVKNELNVIFSKNSSIEDILGKSCEILSNMTNLASVVLGPSADVEKLVSIQLVSLGNNAVTAIFVTDKGYVENKTFSVTGKTNIEDIKKCLDMLNKRLAGTPISSLVPKMESLKPIFKDYLLEYDFIYNALIRTICDFASNRTEFYGKENLLKQPEFKDDAEELKKLFELFNNSECLEKVIPEKSNEVTIIHGDKTGIEDVSVVSKNIKANGTSIGKIAIIGPTRMDYSNVMNSLEYIVNKIMERLNYETISEEKEEKDGGK